MFSRKLTLVIGILLIILSTTYLPGCSATVTTLPPPTTGGLQFKILDPDNKPLAGTKVVSESQPQGQLKVTGITNAEAGVVTFSDLQPGDYQFYISRFDYQEVYFKINVVPGQTPEMVVNLNKLPVIVIPPPTSN